MEAGWSARQVASQLGSFDCVVRRCWDQWIREMSFTRRPGSGCDRQTSRREDCHIWCCARGNWTAAEWSQLVFSDESRFNLSSDDNRVRVWIPRGERLNPAFSLQRHTTPTAGVMQLPLAQQVNDRPDTARVSQDCLCTVTTLPWPARFPDLSPIKHIWDHLERRVWHLTSLNELEARLQKIWNERFQDIIQNLYASMPDCIASCIRASGGSTGY
ncbi:transposable element Tcb2 transposase [Trichonephila clavipes]|nr:transposable element Tcb2 transposase [Trichonephila clavipes]